ncbi:MAG: ABC transporter permease [Spirochaetia bacterium]
MLSKTTSFLRILLAAAILAGVTSVIILLLADQPVQAMANFFFGPLKNSFYFGNFLNTAAACTLTGLAASIAFQAGAFNLGGEGQTYTGGLVFAIIVPLLPVWIGPFGLLTGLAIGMIASALIAAISWLLRRLWNIEELISTFLISGALVIFLDYLIAVPLRSPEGHTLSTPPVPDAFTLPNLLPPSELHIGAFFSIIIAVALFILLYATYWGYELRITGNNPEFALYGGIPIDKYSFIALAASGGIHGIAGVLEVAGTHGAAIQGYSAGLGWTGLAVALIASNHPLKVIPAALFISYLQTAASYAGVFSNLSSEINAIIQGTIFLLITAKIVTSGKERTA